MTREELREKVADAIAYAWDMEGRVMDAADAAIAIIREEVLEEAARECMEELPGEGGPMEEGYRLACEENARNIRALKEKA